MDDHAAEVLAVEQIPVALVDLLEAVSAGDDLVDPEVAGPVEAEEMLMECGFAWLSPLLWRFDKDRRGVWREVPWIGRPPSEYVNEHLRATTAPAHLPQDPVAVDQLLRMMDAPSLLAYASDYPHDHGDGFSVLLDRLDERDRSTVLVGNAAALYGLAGGG